MRLAAFSEPMRIAAPLGATSLVAFSAAAVGAGLGRALVTTYLPVLLSRIRDAPGLIGTVMVVNTIAGFVVPLAAGLWSDRLRSRGHGRTVPFVLGGTILAAGGLAAIAAGSTSSYLALALFAAITYVGLNAVTTGHRALIPENFGGTERAAATGGEEVAMLLGSLLGLVAGGLLIDAHGWAPFAVGAAVLPLLALPTVRRMRGRERPPAPARRPVRYYLRAAARPGARLVLAAQALWVMGYVGLPPFFVLYAERELDLAASTAAVTLAGFGLVSGLTMLAAGAARPERHRVLLAAGAAAMGCGLLAIAAASSVVVVAPLLIPVAAGFGVLTTLGFATYSAFIPRGEEGAYSALYFSVRALAAAIAVPAAGWTIALSGSYRALFVLGGAVTLAALVPLARLTPPITRALGLLRPVAPLALGTAIALAAGLLLDATPLRDADKAMFEAVHGLNWSPQLLDAVLVDPHYQNYIALTALTGLAAWRWGRTTPLRGMMVVAASGVLAYASVRAVWAVWDRARPQELLSITAANGHDWSPYPSFPSGHVAVTVAIVAAAGFAVPRLRVALWAYAAVVALTRVTYGAHFPSDVIAAAGLGWLSAEAALALARKGRHLTPGRQPLRQVARVASVVAVGVFALLLATVGPPTSPEGGVLGAAFERDLQLALLAAVALAIALAWRYEAFGALVVVGGVAIGVLAALEYTPAFAFLACLAFAVPGTLFVLASHPRLRTPGGVLAAGAVLGLVLAAGGLAAMRVHAQAFGPTHPESALVAPPTWRVEWVWAGGVTSDAVTVNAKLTSDARARLLVATSPDFGDPVASPVQAADDERNDRRLSFTVSGLRPRTHYVYGIEVNGRVDPYRIGRFQTFDDRPFSFTFAAAGCARVGSNGAVFDAIRRERPLFFLLLGDFFYANIEDDDTARFLDQYDRALTRPAQGALYRSTPIAYTWDDHDYGGDGADARSPSRPAARSAYRTAVPHYALVADGPIYQAFNVGRVRFLLTDTRSERAGDSMLGAAQRSWLKRELLAARDRGPLTVWVNSVPWIAPVATGDDSWGGYAGERAELARFIARHEIDNLLMISADAHMVAIDDGSHSDYSGADGRAFPVLQAGALDRTGRVKGGPYSEGAFPGSGQYATVRVQDHGGDRLSVTLAGRRYTGETIVRHAFSVPVVR